MKRLHPHNSAIIRGGGRRRSPYTKATRSAYAKYQEACVRARVQALPIEDFLRIRHG